MRKVILVLALLFVLAFSVTSVGAAPLPASVYVVHGIPGQDLGANPALPVDISVGGLCALKGFTFGSIAGPVQLPPGTYRILISLSNPSAPCSNPPVIAENVIFGAAENASVVAHLRLNGEPTLTKFTNYVGFLKNKSNTSRLIIQHTANAPRVDITLQRPNAAQPTLTFRNVANVQVRYGQILKDVPNGPWEVRIFPAGGSTPVFGPVSLNLQEKKIYLVYAVGSLKNNTFTLLLKQIDPAF